MPVAMLGWRGHSLAVRVPADVVASAHLAEGDAVEIKARDDGLIIREAAPRFTATEVFPGRSAAAWRADYVGAYDWGEDVGREKVPD
jgi:antitoxin component of MazEF toxin-antitoxin module